jgi:hypothetical protein
MGCAAVLTLSSLSASAQSSGAAATEGPSPRVRAQTGLEWITAARWLSPAETPLNPGNRILRLPQAWLQTELRPNVRLDVGSWLTVVGRPRVLAVADASWAKGAARRDTQDVSGNLTELYVNWRPNDALQLTYGLQNFQWGPAELLAPSNRLVHETGIFRDPIYYVRGRHLARINLSAGQAWSLVAIAELADNGEPDFNAGEPFRQQALAKFEYASPGGRGYIGGTGGIRRSDRPWFGEYLSFALTEGLSAYIDASHSRGSRAWYPQGTSDGAVFIRRDRAAAAWRTLAVTGARYTFVNGLDIRAEMLWQDAGYSRADLALAAVAAALADGADAFDPYVQPGLEFLGRRLGLASIRAPDLPPGGRSTVQARYLRSFTDASGVGFVTMNVDTTDSLVLFASGTITHGRDDTEFARLVRQSLVGGAVWSW